MYKTDKKIKLKRDIFERVPPHIFETFASIARLWKTEIYLFFQVKFLKFQSRYLFKSYFHTNAVETGKEMAKILQKINYIYSKFSSQPSYLTTIGGCMPPISIFKRKVPEKREKMTKIQNVPRKSGFNPLIVRMSMKFYDMFFISV